MLYGSVFNNLSTSITISLSKKSTRWLDLARQLQGMRDELPIYWKKNRLSICHNRYIAILSDMTLPVLKTRFKLSEHRIYDRLYPWRYFAFFRYLPVFSFIFCPKREICPSRILCGTPLCSKILKGPIDVRAVGSTQIHQISLEGMMTTKMVYFTRTLANARENFYKF